MQMSLECEVSKEIATWNWLPMKQSGWCDMNRKFNTSTEHQGKKENWNPQNGIL